MVFEIEFTHELTGLPDVDELMDSFARRLTRDVADHTRRTLKGAGPLAVREDTGLLKRGLQVRGRANPRFSGTGTIGEIDVELTGEHGSGRAGAFTLPLVQQDVSRYLQSPLTEAAVQRIGDQALEDAIAEQNEDRSSR